MKAYGARGFFLTLCARMHAMCVKYVLCNAVLIHAHVFIRIILLTQLHMSSLPSSSTSFGRQSSTDPSAEKNGANPVVMTELQFVLRRTSRIYMHIIFMSSNELTSISMYPLMINLLIF